MVITWTAPGALWLLLAVPLVWLAHLVARTNFNPRQRQLQAALRALLLAALAVALARPVVTTSSDRQSIVYAVDVSHSVSSRAVEDAARKIDSFNETLRPAHSRIVAFGMTPTVLDGTVALRQLAAIEPARSSADPVDRRGTDLEAALGAARAELASGYVPRIVLFTDGRPTAGDVAAAVARLAGEHIPISVERLAVRSVGDTWVDAVDVPEPIAARGTFTATVEVGSQREAAGIVELRSGGHVLARRPVSFSKGVTRVALDGAFDVAGAHVLEATVSVPNDPLAPNNTLERDVWVERQPKVLYVEGAPASSRYLSGALSGSGFDVTVRPPSGLPASVAALDPWDVVVVSDVRRAAIPDASMSALSEWVDKRGGGLLVAGGEAVFGEGGYRNTALERISPVTFERRDEPEVALILVLDRSWSMAGSSMDLCKAGAQAAVDAMTDEQVIGILTFNDKFDWDVPLRSVGKNRDSIREKIAAIVPSGPTLIYPALEQAYLALRAAKARAKHVVVLSDGRSLPDDYEGLVHKMSEARITVSSVAVGPSADRELLRNIAKWGKGRDYLVANAQELPAVFVKEAKNAVTPGFDEKEIAPVVKTPAFLTGVDLTHVPHLKGRTATVIKDGALEVLATEDGDPLLAFWPMGLGRTAVFASDVKDRWAANWIKWRGYGPFFTSVVRALQRQRTPGIVLQVTPGPIRRSGRAIDIAVEAREASGRYRDLLTPAVQVREITVSPAEGPQDRAADTSTSPVAVRSGALVTVPLRQVAPGRYEASVVADASRPLSVTIAGADAADLTGITSRFVLPDPAAEYRFRPPDDDLLKSIASATGGAWMPTPATLANATGDHRSERRPVWPWLIAVALVLWFLDLVLRRVRVFEPRTGGGVTETAMTITRLLTIIVCIAAAPAGVATAQRAPGVPVTIKAPDGTSLRTSYFAAPAPGPAILLLHQCNADRATWIPLATAAAARGFHVVALDFRGYGESEGKRFANFQDQQPTIEQAWPGDVDAAFAWLVAQPGVDRTRIGIAGASCGVNQAILAASRHPEVKTLVLLSGATTARGREYLRAAEGVPVFAAASLRDGDAVNTMRWTVGWSHNPATTFVELRNAGHGTEMFAAEKRLQPLVLDWFDAHLRNAGTAQAPAASSKPTVFEEFWTLLTSPGGLDRAWQLYDVERRRNPKVSLFPESELNAFGYQRLQAGHPEEAVEILKLNVDAYPRSANTYDSLSDAYLAAGMRQEALAAAKKALKVLAADKEIGDELRTLIRENIERKIKELQ